MGRRDRYRRFGFYRIRIIRLMGKEGELEPDILLTSKIEREIDAQYLDSAKVRDRLGWKPLVQLDVGLERTIDWYVNNWP